jgi:hypothetical protein
LTTVRRAPRLRCLGGGRHAARGRGCGLRRRRLLGRADLLPPNPIVGIRTIRTLHSRDEWRRAHRAAAPRFVAAGAAAAVLGLLAWLVPPVTVVAYVAGAALLVVALRG